MNRRNFLQKLFIGTTAAIISPNLLLGNGNHSMPSPNGSASGMVTEPQAEKRKPILIITHGLRHPRKTFITNWEIKKYLRNQILNS